MSDPEHGRPGVVRPWLAYATVAMVGVAVGLGLFTFSYAEGASYLSNDPAACVNCHVMRGEYDSWNRSTHHAVAVCNDCHTPHAMPDKYVIKGINGFNHSMAFTTGRFPDPIRIKPLNARVAHQACLSCHAGVVGAIHVPGEGQDRACTSCHGNVGHAR